MNEDDDVIEIYRNGPIELRLGRWQDVLADVVACDAVITDPPYSRRTHEGDHEARAGIDYEPLTTWDVDEIVDRWSQTARGWFVAMTDDYLSCYWRSAYERNGRYAFAPVSLIQHRPRLQGDGPGSCTVHILVSRQKTAEFSTWGSLPGWYKDNPEHKAAVNGAKPLRFMRALIRDYTRPGDLVVDPYAGGATTLLACAIEGRRCIGAEVDPVTYTKAVRRLSAGWTGNLFKETP